MASPRDTSYYLIASYFYRSFHALDSEGNIHVWGKIPHITIKFLFLIGFLRNSKW